MHVLKVLPLYFLSLMGLHSCSFVTSPCKRPEQKLFALAVAPYSGSDTEPNLMEPVARALAQKKVHRYVEQRSQLGCVFLLRELEYDPEGIETQVRELSH